MMIPKGLSAKMAFQDGYPAGFVEFLPIEVAPSPVKGENFLFITDIHINDDANDEKPNFEKKGVGRRLVQEVENHARAEGFSGLAVLALRAEWMPAAFFERMEFCIVDQRGLMCLLCKAFGECAQPTIWDGNFKPKVGTDTVHIDVIRTSQCTGSYTLDIWRDTASEFPEKVTFQEHLADDRNIMDIDCMTGSIGIFVDGERAPGYPIPKEEAKKIVEKALSGKNLL